MVNFHFSIQKSCSTVRSAMILAAFFYSQVLCWNSQIPGRATVKMILGDVPPCKIKVVGVGGGGGNAVDGMTAFSEYLPTVEFWAMNTDVQALERNSAPNTLNLGNEVTRGLGAGGIPDVGRQAAEESRGALAEALAGADLVFVTAGMGGGTGTGAAPVVAEVAQEAGALTVGVVTKPFQFEGRKRQKQAEAGLLELQKSVDTLIVVSNDRLMQIVPKKMKMESAFLVADDILRQGVVGTSEIILKPGLINVDFADVKSVMTQSGRALIGIGRGVGRNRAEDAALGAVASPLLEASISDAEGVVVNIVGGETLSLREVDSAVKIVTETISPNANIIFGATVDKSMGNEVAITVIATGLDSVVQNSQPVERRQPVRATEDISSQQESPYQYDDQAIDERYADGEDDQESDYDAFTLKPNRRIEDDTGTGGLFGFFRRR